MCQKLLRAMTWRSMLSSLADRLGLINTKRCSKRFMGAREDLILFLSPLARNTAFQNHNPNRIHPSPKLLGIAMVCNRTPSN
jgi:hypothetical protein